MPRTLTTTDVRPWSSLNLPDGRLTADQELVSKYQPKTLLETPMFIRETVLPPVEVKTETMLGFLGALARLVPTERPVGVKMTYDAQRHRLFLETTDFHLWAAASLPARGGDASFVTVLDVQRALAVLKHLANYQEVLVGMDKEFIHLGPYSFPPGGIPEEFPARPPLLAAEVRVALPAFYLEEIADRVSVARAGGLPGLVGETQATGVFLDVVRKAAVATDGRRIHVLALPRMITESKVAGFAPPSVMVDPAFFRFLIAVVNREWAPMEVSEQQIACAGDDYAALAGVTPQFPDWYARIPQLRGAWVVDRQQLLGHLIQCLQSTPAEAPIRLVADSLQGRLALVYSNGRERLQLGMDGRRQGDGPSSGDVSVRLDHLTEAVRTVRGGLVRLGFSDRGRELTVLGEDELFRAVLFPVEAS